MKKTHKVSELAREASQHIREHLDPNAELPILTDAQIKLVVEKIHQNFKQKEKP